MPVKSALSPPMSIASTLTESSDGFEAVADNTTFGLSNPAYSASRRKLLDLVNRLHATGVQADMDLPMIAVIGSQSAGKSSLIESISGITLPRASGTCTRCPTECRLSSSDDNWKCTVSLRFTTDSSGQPLGQVRNEPFGETIFHKGEVEERIRRAQRAILNPSTPAVNFLRGDIEESSAPGEVSFSKNCISLQISGSNVADLSFCDLPGMIASGSDKETIENLVVSYITKPSCIIMLTVACETDWENQRGFDLVQRFDKEGKRTIGVLTKPDRIARGDHDRWTKFITNEIKPLDNGWFSVKQPDSQAVQEGITWEGARAEEQKFFASAAPWAGMDLALKQYLGTNNLTERLSVVLSALISKRLPELQDELQRLLQETEDTLRQLPKPPSADPVTEILHVVSDFVRDFTSHVEGTPNEHGLLQTLRPAEAKFKLAIRATAPNFRSNTRDNDLAGSKTPDTFEFLADEEKGPETSGAHNTPIYIDEVMACARQAITRELPDHYPFIVSNEYIASIISRWDAPMRTLFDTMYHILLGYVKKLIAQHFGKFTHGNLQYHVTIAVTNHLKECSEVAMQRILWLLDLEKRPHTLNDHYFSDYRDKFLAFYRGSRHIKGKDSIISMLASYSPNRTTMSKSGMRVVVQPTEFEQSTTRVLGGLSEMGLPVKPHELSKLLPSDPFEPALHIMATVRAYFQVAYKRFVDNVPMALDHDLVLGLNRDKRLESVLYAGLGITGPDGHKRCKEFLAEPPQVTARRNDLLKKRNRLETAKRELMDLWVSD